MSTFFYADPHFGHKNVIQHEGRPFFDAQDMDVRLIGRYNAKVGPLDTVYWLGDAFFCGSTRAREIMSMLNGIKILVRGNHDRKRDAMMGMGFALVWDGPVRFTIPYVGPVVLSHYPPAGYPVDAHSTYLDRRPVLASGELCIHGHVHGKTRFHACGAHVGVDAWGFAPVSKYEVMRGLTR